MVFGNYLYRSISVLAIPNPIIVSLLHMAIPNPIIASLLRITYCANRCTIAAHCCTVPLLLCIITAHEKDFHYLIKKSAAMLIISKN